MKCQLAFARLWSDSLSIENWNFRFLFVFYRDFSHKYTLTGLEQNNKNTTPNEKAQIIYAQSVLLQRSLAWLMHFGQERLLQK